LNFITAQAMHSAVLATINSVRPSVTRWYHAKTTPATIMRSSLEDNPMMVNFSTKFQREHRGRGRRM